MPSFRDAPAIVAAADEIREATRADHDQAMRLEDQLRREYIIGPAYPDARVGRDVTPRVLFTGGSAVHNMQQPWCGDKLAELRRNISLEFVLTPKLLRIAADVVERIEQWMAGEVDDLPPSGTWPSC